MADFRRLSDTFLASPQIRVEDVATAAAQGVRTIMMNRPDAEEPGQPSTEEIEAAAKAAGLRFVRLPIRGLPPAPEAVEAMAAALAREPGPVLAFCRSGTRSTALWAYASAMTGADPVALVSAAKNAGYDLSGQLPALDSLAHRKGA